MRAFVPGLISFWNELISVFVSMVLGRDDLVRVLNTGIKRNSEMGRKPESIDELFLL